MRVRLQDWSELRNRSDVARLTIFYSILSVAISVSCTYLFALLNHLDIWISLIPAIVLPLLCAPWMIWIGASTVLRLHEAQQALERLVRTDPLTNALNRRGMWEIMEQAFSERHKNENFCAIIVDLDRFKRINDVYGHAGGDAVIIHVVQIMRQSLEPIGGVVGRFGGDELGALLRNCSLTEAAVIAERLRSTIEQSAITHQDRHILITTSIGVAELLAGDKSPEAMLTRADDSLYAAKTEGRNVVRVDFSRHAA